MKVLILNTSDIHGGAAIAASRLHCGLRNRGVDSKMLVLSKKGNDEHVIQISESKIRRKIAWFVNHYRKKYDLGKYGKALSNHYFSNLYSCNNIKKHVKRLDPDVIHLHWVNDNFFDLADLQSLGKPIVWSLHDMWPFTGGCHYDGECGKYVTECLKCPQLSSEEYADLTNRIFKRKNTIYKSIDRLEVIGLSRWMYDCAKASALFMDCPITNLPNCIDTNEYNQGSRDSIRRKFDISGAKSVILFGGINGVGVPRKGFSYLLEALNHLSPESFELAIFGNDVIPHNFSKFKVYNFGVVTTPKDMSEIYSCADVMVLPSLQENLSNTVIESLSCGTPVVAFDIGGNGDMVKHKCNGYLVATIDAYLLAEGIERFT